MKSLHILIFLLLLSLTNQALAAKDGSLKGQVLDGRNQPLGFVNVAVVKAADSAVVTGAIADIEGRFVIATPSPGKYKLKISMVGYQTLLTAGFEITAASPGRDFGTLIMQEDAQLLQEVTVQAMRPTVVAYADKVVVSVENTALAGGSTAYEVLSKSPGVWVDQDGNIKLNGKAGVQIMINGKMSYLSGKELQNLLQSMSADNIKDLEIRANTSAKYDAEGGAGVININLKKHEGTGFNGSVYGGYRYSELHGYTAGAEINYKLKAWSSYATVDVAERTHFRTNLMQREFDGQKDSRLNQNIREEGTRFVPTMRFGTDYELNKNHSLGLLAGISIYKTEDNLRTKALLHNGDTAEDIFIDARNISKSANTNSTINLHYLGKLDTLGSILLFDLDYVRLKSQDRASFLNHWDSLGTDSFVLVEQLLTDNPNSYDIYSAKADFSKRIGKAGKLDLGAKVSHVVADNELQFYSVFDGKKTLNDTKSSHFIYKENIYAAYASYATQLGEKWKINAGLRAEQTKATGNSTTLNQKSERSYLDLFPSLSFQQTISNNYQINYSYNRSINRPRYGALNPFIFYLDPYTWVTGNTGLKPQYTNSFAVTQVVNQAYSFTLGYAVTKDYMTEIPEQDPEAKTTVFMQQNVEDLKTWNATLVAPIQVSVRWQMNNSATLAYQHFSKEIEDMTLENEQLTFSVQSSHHVQLPKEVRLELNAAYQGPVAYGMYHIDANWGIDAGLKRSFFNDKLDVGLSITDIFKTRRIKGGTNINGNIIASKQYTGSQSFRVNLRYRFSKGAEFKASKRNVNLDEVNRAGGN
ncbi:outer membrane beta-barrel family protein [Pontibacter korlensis]|uniref:TonB-dependent receptor n=1 Tax=Pontibacter korlensis TaxID=400092 RepID=A0A0E3ZFX4_9BACT|nr:outer membrane beta-barrel family protein [Pontibacter korlensis]AKD04554.1 TonB-dependent receptor [Pontibacter korlensis]